MKLYVSRVRLQEITHKILVECDSCSSKSNTICNFTLYSYQNHPAITYHFCKTCYHILSLTSYDHFPSSDSTNWRTPGINYGDSNRYFYPFTWDQENSVGCDQLVNTIRSFLGKEYEPRVIRLLQDDRGMNQYE